MSKQDQKSKKPTLEELRELDRLSKTRRLTDAEWARIALADVKDLETVVNENITLTLTSVAPSSRRNKKR